MDCARDQLIGRAFDGWGGTLIRRALEVVVLAAFSTSCGLVAGLGDPPTYVDPGDGSSGTNSAGVGGASGSTNPAGGTGGNIVGAAGNNTSGAGPGGNMAVVTCLGDCPDAFVAAQEASAISFCRGQVCPVEDSGVIVFAEAGGTCVPGTTAPCGSAATCNAGAMALCDKSGTYGTCPPSGASCNGVPDSWQPVALAASETTCPSGFGSGKSYYVSATGDPLGCSCQCGGTQSCSGSFTLNEYSSDGGPSCMGSPSTRSMAVSPSCGSGIGNVLAGNAYSISDINYAPGPTCSATPTVSRKPQVVTSSMAVCTAAATCPGGACLAPAEMANMCIEKDGTNPCPQGYSKQTLLSPAIDDGRSCGACTCGSTLTCSLTGVLLDNAANCVLGHPYLMTATATCNDSSIAPASFPLNQVMGQGTTTGTGACAETAPSMPAGKAVLQDATTITVCCP